jgi:transcriptional regulator with XRE-family HTH domain
MAARRSLTATPDGIEHINRALTEKKWSREDLAKECDCSRQPAVKFCSGKAVSKKLFVGFCEALGLDWEEMAGLKTAALTPQSAELVVADLWDEANCLNRAISNSQSLFYTGIKQHPAELQANIDAIVQAIRQQVSRRHPSPLRHDAGAGYGAAHWHR